MRYFKVAKNTIVCNNPVKELYDLQDVYEELHDSSNFMNFMYGAEISDIEELDKTINDFYNHALIIAEKGGGFDLGDYKLYIEPDDVDISKIKRSNF